MRLHGPPRSDVRRGFDRAAGDYWQRGPPGARRGAGGAPPEIDRLAVRVLVDSYQFAVAPGRKVGSVELVHFGWGIGPDKPPGKTLISEFGLAMHAQSKRGEEMRNVLVDFGYTSQALINNAMLVGLDPAILYALVLSHGHYDHFGGMAGFLKQYGAGLNRTCPFMSAARKLSARAFGPGRRLREISGPSTAAR